MEHEEMSSKEQLRRLYAKQHLNSVYGMSAKELLNRMCSKECLSCRCGTIKDYTEYAIRHYHDMIGKTVEDFPFEDYADFIIDCTDPSLAVNTLFKFGEWFHDDCYEIKQIVSHSPYLIFRVYRN